MLDRIVLKEHQMFLVCDGNGNIAAHNQDGSGLYWHDTRFLSVFDLELNTGSPQLLSSSGEHNFMMTLQFANQAFQTADGLDVPARSLSIRRNRFLHAALHERIGIFNYNAFPVTLTLTLRFGSDFRDMFDIRGYARRSKHGDIDQPRVEGNEVVLGYVGLDQLRRETRVRFDRPPVRVEVQEPDPLPAGALELIPGISGAGDPRAEAPIRPPTAAAVFELDVPSGQFVSLTSEVRVSQGDLLPQNGGPAALDTAFTQMRGSYDEWESTCTEIVTDDEVLNAVLKRSLHDLRLLSDRVDDGYLPSAGIPWFSVPFGRDSLITALQTLSLQPDIARASLIFLAEHQGKQVNDFRDEQPGKILHEIRLGELAALGQVPHTPYYGSVDATPLWIMTLGAYWRWTNDLALLQQLRPNLDAALGWIEQFGDLDGDGFVEYLCRSTRGIRNQGWKDSADSTRHRDGSQAEPPIALVEVQGYVYAALIDAGVLYRALGDDERAAHCQARADDLRARFQERWWSASDQYFAAALDSSKRPLLTVTSNVGHCLWTGLLDQGPAWAVSDRLVQDDMLCGWGVRTLSSKERSFNPMSYHNGSVWPHDNSILVAGLKRYGMDERAVRVSQEMLDAAVRFPLYRLPELYCGFARDRRYYSMPAQYPVSCSPQAWAAGSVFLIVQSLLGLRVDAAAGRVTLRPTLPKAVTHLSMRRLTVGSHQIDLDVHREGNEVRVDVTQAAPVAVVVEPPSLEARFE
ncbi:MAG: amylo-alpha-1,6-glucosidase [Chloroflexi bacterium]|nr:amylo-alpha-1,6-glucosidase [Chloroflexota bacterium]